MKRDAIHKRHRCLVLNRLGLGHEALPYYPRTEFRCQVVKDVAEDGQYLITFQFSQYGDILMSRPGSRKSFCSVVR